MGAEMTGDMYMDSKVIQLKQPMQEAINEWQVTIIVKPKPAFLLAVVKAFVTQRPLRITHVFEHDPHERPNAA